MTVIHHDHQGDGSTRWGTARGTECCRLLHGRGDHGRVRPYDPDFPLFSRNRSSRPANNGTLPETGGRFGVRTFPIQPSGQPRTLTVSSPGAGLMASSPIETRCNSLSRCRRFHRLREHAFKLTFRRHGHIRQDVCQAPHNHQSVLSSAPVLDGFDANENGLTDGTKGFVGATKRND